MEIALPSQLVRYRRLVVAATHAALVVLAYGLAYAIRFDFDVPRIEADVYWVTLPYVLVVRVGLLEWFRLHQGYWRHFSLRDLLQLALAVSLGSVLFTAARFLPGPLHAMPRSVIVLDWLIAMFLLGGVRLAVRYLRESQPMRRAKGRRTLIIGAGEATEQLLRQLLHDERATMHVVGLIDDDAEKLGRTLHDIPVLGTSRELKDLVARHNVALLVLAMPSANGEQIAAIVDRCRETAVDLKIVPSLDDLLTGRAQIGQLRDVQIEDLLGREPVQLDLAHVQRDLAGKSVLVTGGAGSIGSELARQIALYHPSRLVIFDRAESPLYYTHLEVSRAHPELEVVPVMGSVTNPARLEETFQTYRPDYVFHAAAYKHVPMLEANMVEAVWNNVFGTLRVAECAASHGARKFILISTDKAINPTSILGATKRVAERVVLELPTLCGPGTDFRVVRFGNVLGSDGSVVPLFKRQLAAGGPLRVTHPEVTRYFMTIPEAVQVVLQATALPEAEGRISILEMGHPIRILHLAEQLIRLSGLEPHRDITIEFTGLRPGEKMHEDLVSAGEVTIPTSIDKIRVVQRNGTNGEFVEAALERLFVTLVKGQRADVLNAISALVPEYVPWRDQGDPSDARLPKVVHSAKVHAASAGAAGRPLPIPRGLRRPRPA
jgi:FlaA1/EpsC-like NDP-sugar epimerase